MKSKPLFWLASALFFALCAAYFFLPPEAFAKKAFPLADASLLALIFLSLFPLSFPAKTNKGKAMAMEASFAGTAALCALGVALSLLKEPHPVAASVLAIASLGALALVRRQIKRVRKAEA